MVDVAECEMRLAAEEAGEAGALGGLGKLRAGASVVVAGPEWADLLPIPPLARVNWLGMASHTTAGQKCGCLFGCSSLKIDS